MMREFHQWSQEDMAGKMHMSLSGYAKIERGETKLHYDKLVQMAQIFNTNITDLVSADKVFPVPPPFQNANDSDNLTAEIERLKQALYYKDEIIAHKERELASLRKIISLLEQK